MVDISVLFKKNMCIKAKTQQYTNEKPPKAPLLARTWPEQDHRPESARAAHIGVIHRAGAVRSLSQAGRAECDFGLSLKIDICNLTCFFYGSRR